MSTITMEEYEALAEEMGTPRKTLEQRIEALGVPKRYLDVESNTDYVDHLREGYGIFICGNVGVGKTHLAAQIFKGWIERGEQGLFTSSVDMLDEIRATYDGDGSAKAVTEKFATTRLLVLDDFGKESPTDWVLMKLYTIIDARYGAKLPTITTTQFTARQLIENLGQNAKVANSQAIVSRLIADTSYVFLKGGDKRGVR